MVKPLAVMMAVASSTVRPLTSGTALLSGPELITTMISLVIAVV